MAFAQTSKKKKELGKNEEMIHFAIIRREHESGANKS